MCVLVAFNSSSVTRLFTRFTEEIFTVLIGLFFIFLSFESLWKIHLERPHNQWIVFPTSKHVCNCYEFSSLESLRDLNTTNATRLGSFWDNPLRNCTKSLLRGYVGTGCPEGLMEYHEVFLMSIILFFGTFLLCAYIKKARNTKFLKSYVSG